jgi:RNA polymerase sigma-70 factor (ECF subfamily)
MQTLERFLASVESRAYRMAWIATANRDDALDIVQDAMLRLVRRYGDRPEDEWGPLMHRILQSTIRDWYRRHQVRHRWRSFLGRGQNPEGDDDPGDPLETRVAARDPGPGDQAVTAQTMAQLDRALQALPLRQQQAFLLRQWEGLSVAETATAMACSEGSVKTHYSRALKSLQAQLEDYWQ